MLIYLAHALSYSRRRVSGLLRVPGGRRQSPRAVLWRNPGLGGCTLLSRRRLPKLDPEEPVTSSLLPFTLFLIYSRVTKPVLYSLSKAALNPSATILSLRISQGVVCWFFFAGKQLQAITGSDASGDARPRPLAGR